MKKIFEKMKKEPGFTLLEMSIVIMIIAALLLLIIPNVGTINEKTEDTTSKAVVSTVETQMELYKMDNPEENLSEEELLNKILGEKWVTEKQVEAYKRSKKGE
ncbi:MAG TPA: prepilin-type N-terminal cleavage/methylation domain-containing protein [Candidatus Atopostipes pullistercoris]|uniref:Prepilin-type N-terminal cleavage/methylation domain-containing protein n=1 Tax=Candidatus Atopostipes pullistercoris TaxID=2838467 RepID=A0A9D2JX49_9LACT|nr:prepilin-type N-terminal cleavage/methylation domain-containing protein [Candidatus Atopostipes pullistercoris]